MKKILKFTCATCAVAIFLALFVTAAGASGASERSGVSYSAPQNAELEQNSKYLVMYFEYLMDYPDEQSWSNNYSALARIVKKPRQILKSGAYNPAYPGLAEMIEWFEPMDAYFYARLQDEHIAYITALNEAFLATNTYVERLAICSEIARYASEEDIDPANTEIAELIADNSERLSSLDELKAEYVEWLYANADSFVAIMDEIDSESGYAEIIDAVARAADYYYAMVVADTSNTTAENISAAIEKYNSSIEYMKATEDYSAELKVVVGALCATNKFSEKYTLLYRAYSLLGLVSEDIGGVSAAIEAYEAEYDAYMSVINGTATDVSEANAAVVALRVPFVGSGILNMFSDLLGLVLD